MLRGFSKFGKRDYAKYPFLKAAAKHVRIPDLSARDLEDPQYAEILNRAEARLKEAICDNIVGWDPKISDEIEITSFPVAIMLTVATKDSFIKKRYALSEANRAYEFLQEEPTERIAEFAKDFGWELVPNQPTSIASYEFSVNFIDYLRNTRHLQSLEWKLINRYMFEGKVYLGVREIARLLKEEVQSHIEKRLEMKDLPSFPSSIMGIAERTKQLATETVGKAEMEGFPQVIVIEAFPPCVNALYQAFTSGRHLSHIGRFTLTSFLVNVGMPSEKVIELFRNVSDFNERMTRYQVEHIAGEKGSRTRYIPPKCDTLKTHGVCVNPDKLCQKVRHPLSYYRKRLRA